MRRSEATVTKATPSCRPQASPSSRPQLASEAPPGPVGQRPGRPATAAPQAGGDGVCWEPAHEQCRRELQEARSLAANLEKTVRWWSECSARWKDKWAKANLEKVRCRRECQLLRQKVKGLQREVVQLRAVLEEKGEAGTKGVIPEMHCPEWGRPVSSDPDQGRGEPLGTRAWGKRCPDDQGAPSSNEDRACLAAQEEDPGDFLVACLNSKCVLQSQGGPVVGQGPTRHRTSQQRESARVTRTGSSFPDSA
ncbi:coiled-coil domain-containing protein 102A-like [Mustelus asterias]